VDGAAAANAAAASPNSRKESASMAAMEADASRRASEALEIVGPVPKKSSSCRMMWTAVEALCVGNGWGQTTTDPVLGTCQGMEAFYIEMVVNIRVLLIKADLPELDKRLERSDTRIEPMFRSEITNAVHLLNACLISAHQHELTGSPTDTDMYMAAVGLYNNKDPYAGVCRGEAATQCLFHLLWTNLRHVPKFSLEKSINTLKKMRYTAYGNPGLTARDDKETASGGRKRPPSAAGLTNLPVGTKAAKAAMRRNAREAAEHARVSAALIDASASLAKSSAECNSMMRDQYDEAFWSQHHVRATREEEALVRGQLQRRLRLTDAAAGGASAKENEDQVKDVEVVDSPRRDVSDEPTPGRAASAAADAASLKAAIEAS